VTPEDRDDLCSEVFLAVMDDDFAVLRHFRGQSSLATYLTVIARRIVVKTLQKRRLAAASQEAVSGLADPAAAHEERIINRDEVERLLDGLDPGEAQVVRMYHLESKSYEEISREVGVSENSVGPILSRARSKLRRAGVNPA
jgi:RNA polymerase sigma-70 factor (ECF subfamily)